MGNEVRENIIFLEAKLYIQDKERNLTLFLYKCKNPCAILLTDAVVQNQDGKKKSLHQLQLGHTAAPPPRWAPRCIQHSCQVQKQSQDPQPDGENSLEGRKGKIVIS